LLELSPSHPNLTDVETFADQLATLTKDCRDHSIALSLPNQAMHVGLFRFDHFPWKREEQTAIVAWRFGEELNIQLSDVRLVLQTFPFGQATQVLAVAVRQSILEQYEEACAKARLIPVTVGFALFQMLAWFRPIINRTERAAVVQRGADDFVFILFEHGVPLFLRSKQISSAQLDLRTQVIGSFQFMADQLRFQSTAADAVMPVYVISSKSHDGILAEMGGQAGLTIMAGGVTSGLRVFPLGVSEAPACRWQEQENSWSGLAAAASALS
jgi:Tfp pilus assembly PilM family ATPase